MLNIKSLLTGTALTFACVAAMAQNPTPATAPGASASGAAVKSDVKPATPATAGATTPAGKGEPAKADAKVKTAPQDMAPVTAAPEKTAPHAGAAHKHDATGAKGTTDTTAPDAKPAAPKKADVKKDAPVK
jgi:hypothetical protein